MSWTPGPCARRAAFTPAHALGDREPIVTDDAQLGRVEPLGRVPCELRLRLVARRPTAAGNKRAPSDAPPPGLVRRDTEPLRLHVPHGLVGRKPVSAECGALSAIKFYPVSDPLACLRSVLESVEIDALVFQ